MIHKNKSFFVVTWLILLCALAVLWGAKQTMLSIPAVTPVATSVVLPSESAISATLNPLPNPAKFSTATPPEPSENVKIIVVTKDDQVVMLGVDGESEKISPDFQKCNRPKLSPDKTMVAYTCYGYGSDQQPEILVTDLQTWESTALSLPQTYSSDLLVYAWNGKHLFVGHTKSYWLVTLNEDNWANILPASIYDVDVVNDTYTVYATQKFPVLNLWMTSKLHLLVQTAHYDGETKINFIQYDGQNNSSDLGIRLSNLDGVLAAVSPDGKYLAYYTDEGEFLDMLHVFNLELEREDSRFSLDGYSTVAIYDLGWSGDGRYVVMNMYKGLGPLVETFLYDMQSGQATRFCKCPVSLASSSDGYYLVYIRYTSDEKRLGYGLYLEWAGNKKTIKADGLGTQIPIVFLKD